MKEQEAFDDEFYSIEISQDISDKNYETLQLITVLVFNTYYKQSDQKTAREKLAKNSPF